MAPVDGSAAKPKVTAAGLGIDRRVRGEAPVFVDLDRPVGLVSLHEIQGDHLAAAAGAGKPEPFRVLRGSDHDDMAASRERGWVL